MAQDRSDLPQGTDKVIASASPNAPEGGNRSGSTGGSISGTGAAGNETGGSDVLVDTGAATAPEALGGTGTPAGRATQPSESRALATGSDDASLTEKIRSGGKELTGQAADKARDLVGQALERSGEALSSVSRMIGDTAEGIDERLGEEYGDYARRAAQAIENTASNISSKDPEELIEDGRNFVRRSPAVALAGAAIVGFAVARIVKSTLASSDDRGGNGRRKGS